MIKRETFINEGKLAKFIQGDGNHIINLQEEYFEYCNGYFLINCNYDLDLIIQKLFKIGAISNYKNWTPKKTRDFNDITHCEKEIEAIKTPYLKLGSSGLIVNIFKIGDKFVSYRKDYIDIFKNVEYKVADDGVLPNLRAYGNGEFIGLILPTRDQHDLLIEIIGS